jgi:hypothetical protein
MSVATAPEPDLDEDTVDENGCTSDALDDGDGEPAARSRKPMSAQRCATLVGLAVVVALAADRVVWVSCPPVAARAGSAKSISAGGQTGCAELDDH